MKGLFYRNIKDDVMQIISDPLVVDGEILVVSRCIKDGRVDTETVAHDIPSVFFDKYLINKVDVIN